MFASVRVQQARKMFQVMEASGFTNQFVGGDTNWVQSQGLCIELFDLVESFAHSQLKNWNCPAAGLMFGWSCSATNSVK